MSELRYRQPRSRVASRRRAKHDFGEENGAATIHGNSLTMVFAMGRSCSVSGRRVGVREMQSIMPRILARCPSDSTTSSSTLTICPP